MTTSGLFQECEGAQEGEQGSGRWAWRERGQAEDVASKGTEGGTHRGVLHVARAGSGLGVTQTG